MAAVNSCYDSLPQEERVVFTGKNSLSKYRDLPPTPPSRIKLLHQSEDRSKKVRPVFGLAILPCQSDSITQHTPTYTYGQSGHLAGYCG